MKKASLFIVVFAILVAPFSLASAYELSLGQGEKVEVTLLSSDPSGVKVEINVPKILVESKTAEGETYQIITIPGAGILTQVGKPQVPLVCRFVALPLTSGVKINVVEQETEILSGAFTLYPFQEPPKRSGRQEPQEFILDEVIYSQDKPFPGKTVDAGEISILRDLRLAPIIFYPVRFNPQTGEITVSKKIVVEIKFEGEGENPKLNHTNVLTRSFYKTYQRFVLNFDQVAQGFSVVDGSVLIITYDNFYSQVEPLADWKHKRGLTTYLVNLSEVGSSNTDIYNYIYDAYHNWPDPPEYVILVGDVQQIPTNYGLSCITDHKYATVDGSDYFADVHIGRISVQTPAEAEHVITKILNYRKVPYMGETDWFLKAMTISGSDYVDDQNALRCGFLMVDYAGFTYFDSLWNSNGLDTPSQITTRLNDGRSWIAYFGHGSSTGWWPSGFTNSNIDALSNGEKLPSIVSVACNNGEFNVSGDCFAERWIKAGAIGAEKGAVIIAASTEGSAFFYSDTLSRGTFISYFADSNFHFTSALNEGKMYMYQHFPEGAGGTTERETQMYTTFGDPELDPWSGIPESLEVTHPDHVVLGGAPFPVTVYLNGQPMREALVCLMKDTEMYEVGRTDSTGEVTLYPSPLTPGDAEITITAHNAYPYESTVEVIGGAYIVFDKWYVDDDSLGESLGNSDGDVDLGETIELPIVLKNLGDSTAFNVEATLSTTHPQVSITDDHEIYGDIPAYDTMWCSDDFDFAVSPEIGDSEVVTFQLDITADNGSWTRSDLDLLVHAPVLVYESHVINDFDGDGNGESDPGETCDMTVALKNEGSQGAIQVSADLSYSGPYVAITASSSPYPDIAPDSWESSLVPYRFSVSSNCPPGYVAEFILDITGAGSYSVSDTFHISIGRKPILLVDDDAGASFDTFFVSALNSSGIFCEVWEHDSLGSPSDSVLGTYQAVVWTTGEDFGSVGNPSTLTPYRRIWRMEVSCFYPARIFCMTTISTISLSITCTC